MNVISLEAPAKVNLYLSVLGTIETGPYQGYHDLDMLMQSISLSDIVTIEKKQGVSLLTASFTGITGEIPQDEHNLAMKAWRMMQNAYGLPEGVAIHIEKHIPVGAGLAGGSSDAAAVLKGVNQLFSLGLSLETLAEIGASLGGDVPFCLYQGLARVRGFGERVTPLVSLPSRNCVLVNPGIAVLTSEIFKTYDIMKETNSSSLNNEEEKVNGFLAEPDWQKIDYLLHNDLESAAVSCYPVIAEIKEDLERVGLMPFMSGSGPSVIAFWQTEEERRHIQEKIAPKWAVTVFCRTL